MKNQSERLIILLYAIFTKIAIFCISDNEFLRLSDEDFRHFCKGEVVSPAILMIGKGLGDPALTKLGQGFMLFIITRNSIQHQEIVDNFQLYCYFCKI